MRIMHIIDSLAIGGAERMLVTIANQTAADGHDVFVCITRSGTALASELRPEIRVYELGRRRRFDWRAMTRLSRYLRKHSIEVLHVHNRSSYSLTLFMTAAGLLHTPVVLHDHNGGDGSQPAPFWIRLSAPLSSCRYVGVAEPLRSWAVRAGFDPAHVDVIPNALDLSRVTKAGRSSVRAEFDIPSETPLGIVVAGLRYEKGIDTLIRAVAAMRHLDSFRLLVIGGSRNDGYAASCREASEAMGLDETIVFAGERSDVHSILQDADFAVIPSRSESGPLVLIEYLAAGLPFVSTRIGNVAQTVDAAGIPQFVEADEPDALAEAMQELITLSPEERRHRGSLGRDFAARTYDIRTKITDWYGIYNELVADA